MRILVFTSSSASSGGVRQAAYQVEALRERGHDAYFCLPADSVLWKNGGAPHWSALPKDKRHWKRHLESLFAASKPTIIHAFHRAVNFCAWHGLFWKTRGVYCVSHRGVIFRPKNVFVYWAGAIAAVIANSAACAHSFGFTCPKRKLYVVPNGLPADRLLPTRSPAETLAELDLSPAPANSSNRFIWGYAGNNNPIKGGESALRAFAAAARPEDCFVALGLTEAWLPLCHELGIAGQVRLLGYRPNVANYLQVMNGFISSTSMDSMPNSVMEAMSFGLPIAATSVGGVPEMLSAEALVPLTEPTSLSALAALMRRITDDDSFRTHLADANRHTAHTYTMDARCQALEQIYAAVVKARGTPRR